MPMVTKKMVAMLLAGGQGTRLGVLTDRTAKPAVPFGGKYRIIDFPLSNCVNSDIDTVGVLTQYSPLELNAYLGNGSAWDLDRNSGGVYVLPPYVSGSRGKWYSGTANAIYQNLAFLRQYSPKYVLILSGDHIYKMNYAAMLRCHIEKQADATIAVLQVPMEEAHRFGIMQTDDEGMITAFWEKPKNPVSNNASMGIEGSFELLDGASFTINGRVDGAVTAKTGYVGTGDVIYTTADTTNGTVVAAPNNSVDFDNYLRGITISVGRVNVPNEDGTGSDVVQRMYVTGTAAFAAGDRTDNTEDTTVEFTGTFFVNDTFFVSEEVDIIGGEFNVSAGGTIQVEDRSSDLQIDYIGARYVVETTVDNVTAQTTYYTTFANAMNAIATAYNTEIYISGAFTIDQSYTLEADQVIDVDGTSRATVGSDSTITVNEDATITNTAFSKIEGRVIVNSGGTYRPAADQGIYEVTSSNRETGVTIYSGFKVALDDASSGDVISVVSEATYKGNMTIVSGVTVNLGDGVDLTVTGNVTVQQGGALNLGEDSVLTVGTANRDSTITVAGTVDASENGSIQAAADATVEMYSTGTVTVVSSDNVNVGINSAYYSDGGETVYTSVSNAAAYAAENGLTTPIHATGTFTETGGITLDGVSLIIDNDSNVSLGDVSISDASISVAADQDGATTTHSVGIYSATVTGPSGEGDAAVDSTVVVSRTTATIASGYVLNSSGVNDYSLSIDAVIGNVTVSAGTVDFVGTEIDVQRSNSLTIDSGATLVIAGPVDNQTVSLDSTDGSNNDLGSNYLVNNGNIEITAAVNVEGNIVLGGTVVINDDGSVTVAATKTVGEGSNAVTSPVVLTITGDLTVSAEENNEGTLTVNGILSVGATPNLLGTSATGTVTGEIILGNNGSRLVVVYDGASVSNAEITYNSESAVSTSYVINDIAFATIYAGERLADAVSGSSTTTYLDQVVLALENLETTEGNTQIDVEWYSGEQEITTGYIGDYEVLSTTIEYAGVTITISEGPGLTIYIDDVNVGTSVTLPIGQHTITVYVDAGYEGTPTVTLNGQTITGGSFEITTDMLGGDNIIYATGASPIDYNQGGNTGGSSDDGMGLTDYLLIILVVLIVIMAIMVAMRLMRS